MTRLRRAMFGFVFAAAAVFVGVPPAAPAAGGLPGVQDVNLACNDGTNLDLALDTAAVLALSDAVSAINLYPAGDPPLSCTIDQLTTGSSGLMALPVAYAASGPKDFAVGGGQIFNQFVGCQENFAVSAHVPAGTPATAPQAGAGGTLNLTFPSSCTNPTFAGSHLVSKVDCVAVTGSTANFTATVTKSTGGFASLFPEGSEMAWQVKDLNKTTVLNDEIVGQPSSGPCVFTAASNQGTFSVLNGNITVKDN